MSTYQVELTGKETIYFLFKKKRCPICSSKLKREKKVESLGEGLSSVGLGNSYYGENFDVTLYYRCETCNKLFSISELSGESKSDLRM